MNATLEYNDDSKSQSFQSNGIIAVETADVTTIDRVKFQSGSLLIVLDKMKSTDRWQGEPQREHEWDVGDVAFLPAGSELSSVADRPYRQNIVSLNGKQLIDSTRDLFDHGKAPVWYGDVTSAELTEMASLLHRLVTSGEYAAWPLLTDSLVLATSVGVLKQFAPKQYTRLGMNRSGMTSERTQRVVDFVEANIASRIHLDEMAKAASLSPYHFSRSFKQATGMSPSRYVLDRRIREAQQLLKTTTRPLAEIAHDCGFASQSHFATAFKTATGVAPGLYRRTVIT